MECAYVGTHSRRRQRRPKQGAEQHRHVREDSVKRTLTQPLVSCILSTGGSSYSG